MREFPRGGLIGKTVGFVRKLRGMQIPLHAGYTSFFIVLSVFPALLLILGVLRYTGLNVENLIHLVSDFLPGALQDSVEELIYSTWLNTSGAVVGLSAIAALWSASRGIYGLLRGLNAVYGAQEDRGYFLTRIISMGYTFAFFLVLVLTLMLHVFGRTLIKMLTMVDNGFVIFLTDLIDLRFFLLLTLQSLVFSLMYMLLPNKPNSFGNSLPGGVFAGLGWLVFSDIYSVYVENFSRYANIYGSVYAVALSMLWLYFCVSILFYGGVLNRYWAENCGASRTPPPTDS